MAALHFKEKGIKHINILNRTRSKAEEIAKNLNGTAFTFENTVEAFKNVDIVISATSSKSYVVTADFIQKIVHDRYLNPLLLIDLAVPRDIDPEIDKIEGVYISAVDLMVRQKRREFLKEM